MGRKHLQRELKAVKIRSGKWTDMARSGREKSKHQKYGGGPGRGRGREIGSKNRGKGLES